MGMLVVLGVASEWGTRKGLEVFIKLAKELPDYFAIIMVGVNENLKKELPDRIYAIEKTNSIEELRELYGIADVFLNPTIQDNYPTVNLEAVACETPVITYRTGGSPENSYTPACIVEQKDYEGLKHLILSHAFVNALQIADRYDIGKEKMAIGYQDCLLEEVEDL